MKLIKMFVALLLAFSLSFLCSCVLVNDQFAETKDLDSLTTDQDMTTEITSITEEASEYMGEIRIEIVQQPQETVSETENIDLEELANKIKRGQTYKEVCGILEKDGVSTGSGFTIFTWYFEGIGNIHVYFDLSAVENRPVTENLVVTQIDTVTPVKIDYINIE